jgi:voltage-gated potassium channel
MANLALRPHVVQFFDLPGAGQPGLRLEELAITEGSPLAGRSLQDLRGPAVPLLIRHPNGQLVANPARELQLQAGDVLVVFGQASDLNPLDHDEGTGTSSRARHLPGRGSSPRA